MRQEAANFIFKNMESESGQAGSQSEDQILGLRSAAPTDDELLSTVDVNEIFVNPDQELNLEEHLASEILAVKEEMLAKSQQLRSSTVRAREALDRGRRASSKYSHNRVDTVTVPCLVVDIERASKAPKFGGEGSKAGESTAISLTWLSLRYNHTEVMLAEAVRPEFSVQEGHFLQDCKLS